MVLGVPRGGAGQRLAGERDGACWARIHGCGDDLRHHVAAWGLSCGYVILVRESAEDLFSADLVLGEVDRLWGLSVGLSRCELAEGTARPGCVVMQQVLGQYLAQVVLVNDQQAAGDLPAQGTGHPFADGVRSRRLRWAGENPDGVRLEHGVEAAGELACAIPDLELA